MNFIKTVRTDLLIDRLGLQPVGVVKLWISVALIGGIFCGCVGTGPDFSKIKTDTQKSASYLDSAGIANSQKRMAEQLAESVQKRREQVLWGGVVVYGNKDEGKDLPISSILSANLQTSLVEKLRSIHPATFDIKNLGDGASDNLQSQDALVMVVALASEYTSHHLDPIVTGKIRGEMTIKGHLLFLDSKNGMQLVAIYPVGVTQQNIFDSDPSDADFSTLAKVALMGSERLSDGSAASICDQVLDLLARNAVIPRAIFPPVAVAPVSFGPDCGQANTHQGMINISPEILARWSNDFALAFGSYIGTGSGFPVNPYLPGGGRKINSERALSAAAQITMRTVDNKQLNASLKPPTLVFKVEVASFHSVRNEKKSTRFLEYVDYGITGKLVVVNADTGQLVLDVPFEWPPSRSQRLPVKLESKYIEQSAKLFALVEPNSPVDHIDILQNKIDIFLNQLAREIAFPEEDLARRFENLRSIIKRNAGIKSQPVNYASRP